MDFQPKRTKSVSAPSTTSAPRSIGAGAGRSGMLQTFTGLQAGLGNRGMQQLLSQSVQMKADPSKTVQRMAEAEEFEEEELQMKADPSKTVQRMAEAEEFEEEELQMKADPSKTEQRKSDRMPEAVQAKMEQALGADFSNVKVHQGDQASQVGALAYAQGNDIHFAPGQYQPDSPGGQELLGHELAHIVQQREGRVKPTAEVNGTAVNDDKALEAEADRLGAKAARGQ